MTQFTAQQIKSR